MPKSDDKEPKFHERVSGMENNPETIDLTSIKLDPQFPVQDLVCREEYKMLFESLWDKKQKL